MNRLYGILFACGTYPDLQELTAFRTAGALPFGGQYRLIDFMLSSFVNAGISQIGVVMQERYQSLLEHLGSGKDWDLSRKWGGLKLLPPFSYTEQQECGGPHGEIQALGMLFSYLQQIRQEYVILSPSNLVANLPIADCFAAHLRSGADITAVYVSKPEPENFCGRQPNPYGNPLDVYILSKQLLLTLTEYGVSHQLASFGGEVLPALRHLLSIYPYYFDGYAARISSKTAYFKSSMELFDPQVSASLFRPDRPVRTKDHYDPSTYYGPKAQLKDVLAADGCIIEGSVEHSILFRGACVEQGASVKHCILMQNTIIHAGSSLDHVIADKGTAVGPNRTALHTESDPLVLPKGSAV